MLSNLSIMGILVDKRTKSAPEVQKVLTKFGDSIVSRFGIHDPEEKEHGLITLNLRDKEEHIETLVHELEHLEGVTVKTIYMK